MMQGFLLTRVFGRLFTFFLPADPRMSVSLQKQNLESSKEWYNGAKCTSLIGGVDTRFKFFFFDCGGLPNTTQNSTAALGRFVLLHTTAL